MSGGNRKKTAGGKKQAAAKKAGGRRKAASGTSAGAKPSFLKRLLGRSGKKGKDDTAAAAAPAKKKPLTPLERSIAEIRQLQRVGERDPERLATLLTNILGKEKEKRAQAQETFDRMVWDIVHRQERDEAEKDAGAADRADESADTQEKPPESSSR